MKRPIILGFHENYSRFFFFPTKVTKTSFIALSNYKNVSRMSDILNKGLV